VTISLEIRSAIAVLTLGGSDAANRLDRSTLDELGETVTALDADAAVRALVITGRERTFSLGWDAAVVEEVRKGSVDSILIGPATRTFQALVDSRLPSIAAINGDAFSAGLELALACDLRIASREVKLGFPETASGLIPMGGGTQRLARIAGRAIALEMILGAQPIDTARAVGCGLLNEVTEPGGVVAAACQLAQTIAQRGPLAVRLAKEAIHRGLDMSLDQGLRFETDLTVLLQTSDDRAEGVLAFKDHRAPDFLGR
jgi:enoyl-CoA hydratase/carnithine racemase